MKTHPRRGCVIHRPVASPERTSAIPIGGESMRPALAFLVLALASGSIVGLYREREFGTHHVFVKHRPSGRAFFTAPLGEANRSYIPGREGYLAPAEEEEKRAYVEFVEQNGGFRRSVGLPF